jgi:hypothetical protein
LLHQKCSDGVLPHDNIPVFFMDDCVFMDDGVELRFSSADNAVVIVNPMAMMVVCR